MEVEKSNIPLNYQTIKTTQGRIDKGLLAIPVSLIDLFPKDKGSIYLVADNGNRTEKSFSPRTSSTNECRIGGLREFYNKFSIKGGDELVIQKIDDGIFRMMPEKLFSQKFSESVSHLEKSETEVDVRNTLFHAAEIANISPEKMIENEFVKLSTTPDFPEREIIRSGAGTKRVGVPFFLRNILRIIYNGKCQLTNFSFLMQNGDPYFEIHHVRPEKGNHLKNLLVVSPNVHKQFTYAKVEHGFDEEDWLRVVKFNGEVFNVFQKIDFLQKSFVKEIHFT